MRVNQDVGYVGDNKSSQHVSKNIIDEALENEGDAREPIRHYQILIKRVSIGILIKRIEVHMYHLRSKGNLEFLYLWLFKSIQCLVSGRHGTTFPNQELEFATLINLGMYSVN